MSFIEIGGDACKCSNLGATPAERAMMDRSKLTMKYADKWAPVFGAPTSWLLTLAELESSHNPKKVNMAAHTKGGAWGLLQQMADEVPYKLQVIRRFYGRKGQPHAAEIRKTAAKWKGRPQALLDPDFNMMLAAWQLGRLARVFSGNMDNAFAAYHQGEFAVKRRLARGLPAVSQKAQPKGYAYVQEAKDTRNKYMPILLARLEQQLPIRTPYRPDYQPSPILAIAP